MMARMNFYPGEKLTIRYKNGPHVEADEVPHEATDRICECVTRDDTTVTVEFPRPVKMRDGSWQKRLTIPRWHDLYIIESERLVDNKSYERGPLGDTHMVPVANLWDSYWLQTWGRRVSEWLLKSPVAFKDLERAIVDEGLRAPVMVHRDGTARGGSHRVIVAKRLKWDTIEAYITDTVGKRHAGN